MRGAAGVLAAVRAAAAAPARPAARSPLVGPWGWAVQPAGAALPALRSPLTLATAVAAVAAVRGCGDCPAERHMRRAEARASAIASLASFDARTARRALEAVGDGRTGAAGARLGRPRDARLAVPWRDAVAALRAPGRVVEAAALAGGGTALGLANADRPVAVAAAMSSSTSAPRACSGRCAPSSTCRTARACCCARASAACCSRTCSSPWSYHGAAALGAAGCALAGALPDHGAAALLAVAVAPVVTGCAAMSARRGGRLPPSVLSTAVAADPPAARAHPRVARAVAGGRRHARGRADPARDKRRRPGDRWWPPDGR